MTILSGGIFWTARSQLCRWKVSRKAIWFSTSSQRSPVRVWDFPASDIDSKDEKTGGTLYTLEKTSWQKQKTQKSSAEKKKTFEQISQDTLGHLLPAQYPKSVAPGYLSFASFCFTASVAGSAAMVLSTQTLLLAVGVVGSSTHQASIMAGAFNWVMKDFVGQLGGVVFASQMGKTRAFDTDPKRWRMVAAMCLDGATFLEILAPLFHSSMVLPVASLANIGKNIGFLTASASRAALHQSLAVTGNLGDVTAKAGSQSIMASLIGTTMGIGLSSLLSHDTYNFAMGFCVLAVIHQGCNYLSLKYIPLCHFNRQRLGLVLEQYIMDSTHGVIPSPVEVAKQEMFFPLLAADSTKSWLSIGSSLEDACPVPSDLQSLLAATSGKSYLINTVGDRVHLVFFGDACGEDKIRGMVHAFFIRQATQHGSDGLDPDLVIQKTNVQVQEQFPALLEQLHASGWKTCLTSLESRDARRLSFEH